MRIGVLCPSEIAYRRFVPALAGTGLEYAGVGYASVDEWKGSGINLADEREKALKFQKTFGGEVYASYKELLDSDAECIYVPLPPALHYEWGLAALNAGKHILMEKPFTTNYADTQKLIRLAEDNGLMAHENYAFVYHGQLEFIFEKFREKAIGELRMIRIDFGFPFRGKQDFRYDKAMGGGALLDAGGYVLKLASMLLGDEARIVSASAGFDTVCYTGNNMQIENKVVDLYGSASLVGSGSLVCQVSYGMDNEYRCNLDIWGSKGCLFVERVLTTPPDFQPKVKIVQGGKSQEYQLPAADSFKNSISTFYKGINCIQQRELSYKAILLQANLIERCKELCESQN